MINVDISLLFQIVNFLALVYILNLVIYKPIRSILIERREKRENLGNIISSFDSDASNMKEKISNDMRAAKSLGIKEKEEIVAKALDDEKEILSKINKKAQKDMAEIKEKIKKEALSTKDLLKKELDSFAGEISSKLLGRSV